MGLSTLLLIGAICSAEGPDKICTYVDVTERMEVVTDDQCFQIASIANADAVTRPDTPRYGCIKPEQYRALIGESEYLKLTRLPEQL
jgi:hypothetical protein